MTDSVSVDSRIYTFVKDFQSSYQVLVSGLVRDALTKEAPTGPITISLLPTNAATTDQVMKSLLSIKVLGSGLFYLAGKPERIFPALSTTDYTLVLQVQVPGYKDKNGKDDKNLTVSISKNSTFPLQTIPPIDMQRLPIRMQGRVMGMSVTPASIVGASVLLLDEPNPAIPLTEHVIALRTPLYFSHTAGTTIQQRQLTSSGTAKQLAASVTHDDQTLTLSDPTGLAINDVVLIGTDAAGEYGVIGDLPQGTPAQVTLRNKLKSSFAVGTTVQKYVPGATGTSTTLVHAAEVGDGVLFLPINLPSAPTDLIEIVDATAAHVEYHALGAITDANGYYRLDGFTGVQTVYMEASATGFDPMNKPTAWTIDYGQPVNAVDFQLLPKKP